MTVLSARKQSVSPHRPLGVDLALFFLQRLGGYLLILLGIVLFFMLTQFWTRSVYLPDYSFGEATWDGLKETGRYLQNWFAGRLGAQNPQVAEDVRRVLTEFYPRSMGLLLLSFLLAAPAGISLGALAAFRERLGVPRRLSVLLLGLVWLLLAALAQLLLHGSVADPVLRWLFALAISLGLLAGLWILLVSLRQVRLLPLVTLSVAVLGISVPSFFLAVFLQAAVIQGYRVSGGIRILPVGGFGWDLHIVLPALVLMARPLAQVSRVTFTTLSRLLEADFVRTARAKGATPWQVNVRHILRNAAVPIITAAGVSLRFSLSSLPVVELLFGWNGIGYVFFQGVSRTYRGEYQLAFLRSPPAINVTILLLLCLTFIVINLILELTYRALDPRIREVGLTSMEGAGR